MLLRPLRTGPAGNFDPLPLFRNRRPWRSWITEISGELRTCLLFTYAVYIGMLFLSDVYIVKGSLGIQLPTILKVATRSYSADAGHEEFWRVGIARNAAFFHSFVAPPARKVSSE